MVETFVNVFEEKTVCVTNSIISDTNNYKFEYEYE